MSLFKKKSFKLPSKKQGKFSDQHFFLKVLLRGIKSVLIKSKKTKKETVVVKLDQNGEEFEYNEELEEYEYDENEEVIKFKGYHVQIYKHLRKKNQWKTKDFFRSLCSLVPLATGGGRSGAYFYLTTDHKLVLKNMSSVDKHSLDLIVQPYYQHLKKYPQTLLPIFLGQFGITFGKIKLTFIIMNYVFDSDLKIHKKYDLKGSQLNRGGDHWEKEAEEEKKVLKDNDLNENIQLTASFKKKLKRQIKCDAEFLKLYNLMDYSLLLGIHYFSKEKTREIQLKEKKEKLTNGNGNGNQTGKEKQIWFKQYRGGILGNANNCFGKRCVYFIGLIDILQPYNTNKKMERGYKAVRYLHTKQMSSVNPKLYLGRFMSNLDLIIETKRKRKKSQTKKKKSMKKVGKNDD
ncbi:phosphatidylinositol 5-phosphate 4-kinase isoform a [Anaeramoeba flamelloides]|uniref:Phosphatidylinositol 5-phosphate 4-kinase isoform a n=1 Tax=Anaeramoeba flamelloides TaxID=1746091 RepID=A0AAV7ZES2_9EUKA|nr:phosphatidylinositol 5-phosphate 4-kinase isoform a [Anaeramoeba flamelloides]